MRALSCLSLMLLFLTPLAGCPEHDDLPPPPGHDLPDLRPPAPDAVIEVADMSQEPDMSPQGIPPKTTLTGLLVLFSPAGDPLPWTETGASLIASLGGPLASGGTEINRVAIGADGTYSLSEPITAGASTQKPLADLFGAGACSQVPTAAPADLQAATVDFTVRHADGRQAAATYAGAYPSSFVITSRNGTFRGNYQCSAGPMPWDLTLSAGFNRIVTQDAKVVSSPLPAQVILGTN